MSPLTQLYPNVAFDPTTFPALITAMRANERGQMELTVNGANSTFTVHVYFRWVPTDNTLTDRLLVICGVSPYSINQGVSGGLIMGTIVFMLVAAAIVLANIIILSQLGYIWSARSNKGAHGKWRTKTGS